MAIEEKSTGLEKLLIDLEYYYFGNSQSNFINLNRGSKINAETIKAMRKIIKVKDFTLSSK